MNKALGMIETKGLIGSITAADAMVKSADIRIVKQEKISAALVTIFVEGDVSAVIAAVEAGKEEAEKVGELIDYHIIPHPDKALRELLNVKTEKDIDTKTISQNKKEKSTIDSKVTKANENKKVELKKDETATQNKKTEKSIPTKNDEQKPTPPKDKKE